MSDEVEKGTIGSSFEDFLRENNDFDRSTDQAVKRVYAFKLKQEMAEQKITKVEMAKRLATSRSQLNRMLDPDNDSVTISSLVNMASAVGKKLHIDLV